MKRFPLIRWLPALLVMLAIYWLSSQPQHGLPDFGWADRLVKKSGHVLGYALLAATYWNGFALQGRYRWYAWLLAIVYAVTDELHQSFVPGRNPSAWDVLVFDNVGALAGLWLAKRFTRQDGKPR